MIRALWRIGDAATRRGLAGYLAILVTATALVAATYVSLIPLIRGLVSAEPSSALPCIVATAVLGISAAVAGGVATIVGQRVGADLVLRMHTVIGDRVAGLPLGWFGAERIGRLSQLVTRGVSFAANAPDMMLRPVLQGLAAPVVAGVALWLVDARLGAVLLAAAGVIAAAYRWAERRGARFEQAADASAEEGASRVLEFAFAQPAVRVAGPDSLAERRVRAAVADQQRAARRLLAVRGRGMTLYTTVCYAALLAIAGVAVSLVTAGAIDRAAFIAVLVLGVLLAWLALTSLPFGTGVQMARRTLDDLIELLDTPMLPEPAASRHPAPDDASIEFLDVGFAYPGSVRPVIVGASFVVAPGTTTAIVGPSGAGKSTLVRLIARFHDVGEGSIRIGGRDVRELGTRATMAQVSMVFQDVHLFEDTLRENIRLGRAGATDEEVAAAATLAGVDEIADRLPEGYDTRVGEGGGTLSGGERQRVSIARALLKDAPIVLLDEATAALDVASEAHVQRALAALSGTKTFVVVAHRLQTIRHADQIVVLDGAGGVEAVGTHDALLTRSATYARFWASRQAGADWRIDAR